MPRWVGQSAKKEVPKKTVVFLRHFYTEIIPRNPPVGQVVFVAQKTTVFFGNEHSAHRGDEMNMLRKIFLVVICAVLATNTAMASEWKVGYDSECYREKKKAGVSNIYYYYCGKQNPSGSCRGLVRTKSMHSKDFKHGDIEELDGAKRICCHGTSSVQGKWVKGNEQKTYYDKTIEVGSGGGTCTYKVTHDICEDEDTGTECTVPDTCPSGKVVRDGDCVTAEQETPKTSTETAKKDDTPKKQATEPEKPKEETTKQDAQKITSATKTYSNDMMYECYRCSSDIQFKKCLEIYRTAPDELSNIQKSVLKACNNTYDAANAKKMVAKLKALVPDATEETKPETKYKNLAEQYQRMVPDEDLSKYTQQATQVSDAVAVADQVAVDDIYVPATSTSTTSTTATPSSIADALKNITNFPGSKFEYTTVASQAM